MFSFSCVFLNRKTFFLIFFWFVNTYTREFRRVNLHHYVDERRIEEMRPSFERLRVKLTNMLFCIECGHIYAEHFVGQFQSQPLVSVVRSSWRRSLSFFPIPTAFHKPCNISYRFALYFFINFCLFRDFLRLFIFNFLSIGNYIFPLKIQCQINSF